MGTLEHLLRLIGSHHGKPALRQKRPVLARAAGGIKKVPSWRAKFEETF